MAHTLSTIAALLLAAAPAWAADKPVMTWLLLDLPPTSIIVDGKLTDGISDTTLKLIMQEWPEADHRTLMVNGARGMAYLAEGFPACFAGIIMTPEREKLAYFTQTHQAAPLHLVARADIVGKIAKNSKGEVLPATLFDRSDLRGIVVPQRSYSPVLDALLNLRGAQSGVRNALAADSGANILKMLNLGRGDYTIEYDFVLAYQQKRNPELLQPPGLKSVPLAGTSSPKVGIGCPHTDWGREAVQKIDAIMVKISKHPDYLNSQSKWLTPDALKSFKKTQDEFFKLRAKPTDPSRYEPWLIAK